MKLHFVLPAAVALGLLAGGCSMFEDEPEAAPAASPPKEGEFPNLGNVPQEAPPSTPRIEREQLIQGLQADKANAEYTGEALGESVANVEPAAAPPPGPPKPEEPAAAEGEEGDDEEAAAAAEESDEAAADADEEKAEQPPPVPADLGEATALIYFGEATAELTDFDRSVLADVASMYVRQRGSRVYVIGHTSTNERAAEAGETDLATARAAEVAQTLMSLGVPANMLVTSSGGAKYDESSPNGVAANRRVEIYIGA